MTPPDIARVGRPAALIQGWPKAWRLAAGRVALAWIGLIVLFHRDWAAMADQWWNSSTYTHILLVPAILAWLVSIRAPQLSLLTPIPWWPGFLALFGAAALWLLGHLASFSLASQAGAVGMLVAAAIVLLGPKASVAMAFPFAYMAFLVPFGDELVPALQLATAELTTALVRISGIPARIDGVFITTPAGLFEVAEACSGVKFLIAMIAFATLVGNVCFRRWSRRIVFFVSVVVLSVVANGVRAWGTIFVAQYVGAERATGFDHLVYGWIFFAIVIGLALALAWPFFDRLAADPMFDDKAIQRSVLFVRLERYAITPLRALLGILGLVLLVQVWAHAADRLSAPLPSHILLPDVPAWQRVPYSPRIWWEPRARGAERRLLGRYRDAAGREVDVFFALYASQGDGKKAGGFGEGALAPDTAWAWLSPGISRANAKTDRLLGAGRQVRLAETSYRTGEILTGSTLRLKAANVADRLMLRTRPTMILILSSEAPDAAGSLQAFRASIGPVARWMDRIAGLR